MQYSASLAHPRNFDLWLRHSLPDYLEPGPLPQQGQPAIALTIAAFRAGHSGVGKVTAEPGKGSCQGPRRWLGAAVAPASPSLSLAPGHCHI